MRQEGRGGERECTQRNDKMADELGVLGEQQRMDLPLAYGW